MTARTDGARTGRGEATRWHECNMVGCDQPGVIRGGDFFYCEDHETESWDDTGRQIQGDADGRRWPFQQCPECNRVFNLTDDGDANEWAYGHDCEATQ